MNARTEVTNELNEVSDSNGDENFEHSEGESAHDDTYMPSNDSECENEKEDSLSVEEISALLALEYQKHIDRNGPNFFSNHHGEQGDGSVHTQEVLDERDDHSEESYSEVEVEHHMVYEQEESLEDNVDEDIRLVDDTFVDPEESSHDSMAEFSIFLNPLFEEVIEDRSEFFCVLESFI